jgi:hypothetical protein
MMKGNSWISEKYVYFSSLHLKRKLKDSKSEKYFDFPKMDKKNVQKSLVENVLTDRIFKN